MSERMGRVDFVNTLLEIAARVNAGDCRGGSIEFNGYFAEHEGGEFFDVSAAYRTDNNDGQGSMVMIGRDHPRVP